MSLTHDDLSQIRTIVRDEVRSIVREEVDSVLTQKLKPIEGEIQALRNDIKEIYAMIAKLEKGTITDRSFEKLTLEEKLLHLNAELLAAAKQAGITLPR